MSSIVASDAYTHTHTLSHTHIYTNTRTNCYRFETSCPFSDSDRYFCPHKPKILHDASWWVCEHTRTHSLVADSYLICCAVIVFHTQTHTHARTHIMLHARRCAWLTLCDVVVGDAVERGVCHVARSKQTRARAHKHTWCICVSAYCVHI